MVRIDTGTLTYYTSTAAGGIQSASHTATINDDQTYFFCVRIGGTLASPTMKIRIKRYVNHVVCVLFLLTANSLCAALKSDNRTETQQLVDKARSGNIAAQVMLGMAFQLGKDAPPDLQAARYWYKRAAQDGHRVAQFNLAVLLRQYGEDAAAVYWFTQGAQQGLAQAQRGLSIMYREGEGTTQDLAQAFKWCYLAAEQGLKDAQFDLGAAYDRGRGVGRDSEQAIYWWLKAAEHGHADAQYNLGLSFELGDGIDQDFEEAAKWYQQAARQRHPDAQLNLGSLYANGKGIERDLVKAHVWVTLAANKGLEDAASSRDLLEAHMLKEEIEEAMRLSRQLVANFQELSPGVF